MTFGVQPIRLGEANGQSIIANADSHSLGGSPLVTVTLTANYVRSGAPGWIVQTPAGSPVSTNPTAVWPATIAAGTTLTLTKAEASALVAAGAATVI